MGLGITSHKSKWSTKAEIILTFPLFHTLIPSFCDTASSGYSYHFFLAYDTNDEFFANSTNLILFRSIFHELMQNKCNPRVHDYHLHFVQCVHNKHPAWAQNDAMMSAYMSNMEYYYRINDDTEMITKGWTETFIHTLQSYNPPNVGVVGPAHTGGLTYILTYDFVHYTHIEIHGFYYPRRFKTFSGDVWITIVYQPDRYTQDKRVILKHTQEQEKRYSDTERIPMIEQKSIIAKDKVIVER